MMLPDKQRLEHIRDYCVEILITVNRYGNSFEIFDKDLDYQKSISFSLLQIGELSGKLSDEYREKSSGIIKWSAIKGMRNIFAHNYGAMSRDIIFRTAVTDVPSLLNFCNSELENK